MKYSIVLFLSLLLLGACKPEEITVNAPYTNWKLLAVTNDPVRLALIDQPENSILQQDAYQFANGAPLPGRVSHIVNFRDTLYMFIPEQHTIEIVSKFGGYKRVATLNFTKEDLVPADIAFPNATTGYIAFSNKDMVGIIDLTQLPTGDQERIFISTIPVGKHPSSITALNNKILTANTNDNTVSVIDSRTNEVTKTIQVHTAPLFIRTDADGAEAIVVSAGAGKLETDEVTTPAKAQFIDGDLLEVGRSYTLYGLPADSLLAIPAGLVISQDEFAFIPLQTALVTVNTRKNQASMRSLERKRYHSIALNRTRNEVLVLDSASNKVTIFNGRGGRSGTLTMPVPTTLLMPQ